MVSLSTHTDQLFMELVCGQLLQEGLRWKQEGKFNHGIRHETLIVEICFLEVQKGCKLKEVQEWKVEEERNL